MRLANERLEVRSLQHRLTARRISSRSASCLSWFTASCSTFHAVLVDVKVRLLFFVGDLTRLDPFRAMSSTVSIIRVKRRMAGVCHPIAHAKRTRGSQLICMPNCMLLTAASQKVS
jgi:hypothetical protein